jgi:VWFA-related protein
MKKYVLLIAVVVTWGCGAPNNTGGAGSPFIWTNGFNSPRITQESKTPAEPCTQVTPPAVASQAGYRQLTISMVSAEGSEPSKLVAADLKIDQGGNEIPVKYFHQEAVSLGILVDSSGSMEPKKRQAEATLDDLIDGLNPEDQAFLMTFSNRVAMLQNYTSNHDLLKQQMALIHPFGQTSLRDSVITGLAMLQHGCNQTKALFVMTDGMDNISSITVPKMMDEVKESGVPIFALGIGNPHARSLPFIHGGGDEDRVDTATLRSLAEATGGRSYILPEVGGSEAKATAIAIANGIDNHYVVGVIAGGAAKSKIRIELVNHPGSTLKIEDAPGSRD